jgi:bifunctional non-homologous end joining protein LigD
MKRTTMTMAKAKASPKKTTPSATAPKGKSPANPTGIQFSHLEKVMFPAKGYTKGDLLTYYAKVAPKLLPHLRDRPITLERLPDGVGNDKAPRFWQKNTPSYYPDWIPRINLPNPDGKPVHYALVNDLDTLMYLVNQGAITFHVWFSRTADLDRPDFVLFDLDPSEATFKEAVIVAKRLREVLDEEKVKSFPKTSGKTGLHVLVPWTDDGGYDEARGWAVDVAQRVVRDLPEIATMERSKDKRKGRLYLDVMQNVEGRHAVPPYVVRATAGATVSTPLSWDEVNGRLDPKKFDLTSAIARFAKQRKDPMAPLSA